MDIDPTTAFNFFEETINTSSLDSIVKTDIKLDPLEDLNNDNLAAFHEYIDSNDISGFEPVLGGELREKAVWVDESACIGCQYCVHVATNTFFVDENYGLSLIHI